MTPRLCYLELLLINWWNIQYEALQSHFSSDNKYLITASLNQYTHIESTTARPWTILQKNVSCLLPQWHWPQASMEMLSNANFFDKWWYMCKMFFQGIVQDVRNKGRKSRNQESFKHARTLELDYIFKIKSLDAYNYFSACK